MEITIKDKTYKAKYSIRAMMAFEKIAGKSFEITNYTDLYIFCYSMLLAGMDEELISFDDFIDACDDNPEIVSQLSEFMNQQVKINNPLGQKDAGKKKRKK